MNLQMYLANQDTEPRSPEPMPIRQDEPPPEQTEAQRLYVENLELRDSLLAVATELERMSAHEGNAENQRALLALAQRIRWRVHHRVYR